MGSAPPRVNAARQADASWISVPSYLYKTSIFSTNKEPVFLVLRVWELLVSEWRVTK